MKAKFGALGVALMTLTSVALAIPSDGNELLTSCKAFLRAVDHTSTLNDSQFQTGQCIGKVSGVKAAIGMYSQAGGARKDLQACFGNGVTDGQGVRVVVKFLEDNPRVLNEDGNSIIMVALLGAFPCP